MRVSLLLLSLLLPYTLMGAQGNLSLGFFLMAKENTRLQSKGSSWLSSLAMAKGKPTEFIWFPSLAYQYQSFSVRPMSMSYSFLKPGPIALSTEINYSGPSYHSEGMKKRRSGVMAGGTVRLLFFQAKIAKEISDYHHGTTIDLSLSHGAALTPQTMLRVGLGAEWYDQTYANYYYGVGDDETTSLRPYFLAKSSWNPKGSLMLIHSFSNKSVMTLRAEELILGSGVADSPTIRKKDQFSLMTTFTQTY